MHVRLVTQLFSWCTFMTLKSAKLVGVVVLVSIHINITILPLTNYQIKDTLFVSYITICTLYVSQRYLLETYLKI